MSFNTMPFGVSTCAVLLALLISSELAFAQSEGESEQTARRQLSGPTSVENQLKRDIVTRGQTLDEIQALKPWFAWKEELTDKHGFTFATDYTVVAFKASDSLDGADDNSSGGVFRFFGTWDLFDRGGESPGKLVWRFTDANSYTDIAPLDFSLNGIGNVSALAPVHDDNGSKLANLYWHQDWSNAEHQINAGFFDTADLMEFYALTDPFFAFQNLAFLNGGGTVPLPSAGSLGFTYASWLSEQVYFIAGIVDANGDPKDPADGFETFFDDKEFFTFAEIGWTKSSETLYLDDIHLTVWQVDERDEAGTEDGWGTVFSFARYLDDKYLPFFKAGYANDGSSLLEKSVSIGLGYQPWLDQGIGSLYGIGFNWGEPNSATFGSGLDDQYAVEAFYRWQISREIALTPSIEFFKDPALNPDEDQIWMIGTRLRIAL
jgi:porin